MSFRARLTLVAAAAVALAVVIASLAVYLVVRGELYGPIDDGLKERAAEIQQLPPSEVLRALFSFGSGLGVPNGYPQVVRANGDTALPRGQTVPLPVGAQVLAVAAGKRGAFLVDTNVAKTHVRVLTFPYATGYAVQVARPLTEVDHTLRRVTLFLVLIAAGGIAVAVALGLAVSRAALAPVRRLTEATENVTATGDLSDRIDARGRDELSRLAGSFNAMLGALEESTRSQRQLVADASHELR
ncbi:MAG: HAMP domain-containing protein, partial [Gaiellaceae bacterium]